MISTVVPVDRHICRKKCSMGDEIQGPKGLAKSLDDLIAEQRQQKRAAKREKKKADVGKRDAFQNTRRGQRDTGKGRMLTDKVFRIRGGGSQKQRGARRVGHGDTRKYRDRSPETYRRDDFSQHGRRGGRGGRRDDFSQYRKSGDRGGRRDDFTRVQRGGRGGRGGGYSQERVGGAGNSFSNFGNAYFGMTGFTGQQLQYDGQPRIGDTISQDLYNRISYSWTNQGVLGIMFDGEDIAQLSPTGDVYIRLSSSKIEKDGSSLIDAMNYVLSPINVKVLAKDTKRNFYQISDGSSLVRYQDGIVVHGKGQIGRASMVMHHLESYGQGGNHMQS